MIGEFTTPADVETGIPLPLMPVDGLPPVPVGDQKNRDRIADWHHPFHPRDELVHGTIGTVALRNCRVQWAKYEHHHNTFPGYHAVYSGPEIPKDEYEQFRTVVLASAGYIPRRALAFERQEEGRIRELSDEQRIFLWESGQIRVDKEIPVRDFIIHYLVKSDFIDKDDSKVDEFLHTRNMLRKSHLGNTFLRAASYEAVSPINPLYRNAKRKELLPVEAPHSAGRFVLVTTAARRGRMRAFQALTRHFEDAA